ncbi:MAG: 4'-phosphopantetheinyl transferase superfamily protein [Ferruginibacter sp.]
MKPVFFVPCIAVRVALCTLRLRGLKNVNAALFQKQINDATKIGVWHITEAEDFFLEKVPLQRTITHPHKRLQHLAGRYLLPQLFPAFPLELVEIADTRKPFLPGEPFHFSISHCGNYAAAIVSMENRVGVDIEIPHPRIGNIKHKFLSPGEQHIVSAVHSDDITGLTMAWSVKEAVFKWFGEGEVDFIGHMQITAVNKTATGYTTECLFKKDRPVLLRVKSTMHGNNNLSRIVTDPMVLD